MAEIQPNWGQLYSNTGIRFGNNAGLDALNQKYAMFQQQRQLDAKQFSDVMAKMNFGGVKPADLPDLQKQFGDILQTYSKSRSTTDPKEQASLAMELKLKQQQMAYDIANRRETHASELKLLEAANHPNNYPAEGSVGKIQGLVNKPSTDPEYQKTYSDVQGNMFDKPIDTDKLGDGIFKRLMDKQVSTGAYKFNPTLGMYERGKTTATSLDKGALDKEFSDYLVNNPKDAHRLMDKWNIPDVKELAAKLSDNTWEANKGKIHSDTVMEAPHESFGQKQELMRYNAVLRSQYPTYGQAQSTKPTPSQILVFGDNGRPGLKQNDPTAIEKFKSLIPKGTYEDGQSPSVQTDPNTGEQVWSFPRQKIKTNGKHLEETTYKLNPSSPDYGAQAAQMAVQQHINLTNLDKIEGVKGHGQVPGAQAGSYEHQQTGKDAKGDKITIGYKNGKWYNIKTGQVYE